MTEQRPPRRSSSENKLWGGDKTGENGISKKESIEAKASTFSKRQFTNVPFPNGAFQTDCTVFHFIYFKIKKWHQNSNKNSSSE